MLGLSIDLWMGMYHGGAAPTLQTPTLDLDDASDTGSSPSDNITNDTTPDLTTSFADGFLAGDTLHTALNGTELTPAHTITAGEAGGSGITLTYGALSDGSNSIVQWITRGTDFSAHSTPLVITVDTAAPTLSSSSPSDGSTTATASQDITLTFNETVALGTGNFSLKLTSDDSTIETFNAVNGVGSAGGSVSVGTTTITIDPNASMTESAGYYLLIADTCVTDLAGNAFTGYASDKTKLNWTVADATAPTLTTKNPLDGATGSSITSSITAQYNETVVLDTGNITLVKTTGGTTTIETFNVFTGTGDAGGTVSLSTTTLTNDTVVINPFADLLPSTAYYINIAGTCIKDGAGNHAAAISNATDWNFTTSAGAVTLDPAKTNANITLSGGDLTATRSATGAPSHVCSLGTSSKSTGKWYFKVTTTTVGANGSVVIGIGTSATNLSSYCGSDTKSIGKAGNNAVYWAGSNHGISWPNVIYVSGSTVEVCVDLDAGWIWWRVPTGGNVWNNDAAADPAANTTAAIALSGIDAGPYFPVIQLYTSGDVFTVNFLTGTPPSGFTNWSA